MALTKLQKQKIISQLEEKVDKQKSIVFADFKGLKVKDLSNLRNQMKEKDCELKVAKKSLLSLIFKQKKIEVDIKKMTGEIVLGFGYKDEIMPFKALYEFSKNNENLKILSGLIGKDIINKDKSLELGQLPSKQELLGRLLGSIKSPISGLVNVLEGNLRNLVYLLSQLQTKGQI